MKINEIEPYLKDKYILKTNNNTYVYLKNDYVVIFNNFSNFKLKIKDFYSIYQNNEFILINKNDDEINTLKDDEYYSLLLKRK